MEAPGGGVPPQRKVSVAVVFEPSPNTNNNQAENPEWQAGRVYMAVEQCVSEYARNVSDRNVLFVLQWNHLETHSTFKILDCVCSEVVESTEVWFGYWGEFGEGLQYFAAIPATSKYKHNN